MIAIKTGRWLCVLLLTLLAAPLPAAERNIVLFVTDDQSPDAGCYGNTYIQTPSLDQLAADGVLFREAFCTTASCSASRSVILTGLHNHANGQYGHQHAYHKFASYPWVASLPVMLGKLGYRTARIGKFHVAPEEVYQFETRLPGDSRSPVRMAEQCQALIEAEDERPFFLLFATSDPHRGGGTVNDSPLKPNRFGNRPHGYPGVTEITYEPARVTVPPFLPDTPACRAELAQYYQSISRIDQGLGRLIEILKAADEWDRTLFVFTADHGMAFPGAKTTVYEGGLRVPLVLRNPYSSTAGSENHGMVSLVDLTPTLLDFAGGLQSDGRTVKRQVARRPRSDAYRLHGRSLLGMLGDTHPTGWDVIHASHTFHEITMYYPMRVIRDRQYKLIWNIAHDLPYPFASDLWIAPTWQTQFQQGMDAPYGRCTVGAYIHRPEFELYHIADDPHEQRNLAADPSHAEQLARYQSLLRQFQRTTDDPWVLKWEYE